MRYNFTAEQIADPQLGPATKAVRSCVLPVSSVAGKKITTIEGISETATGKAVQTAWQAINVPQCGYCQAGQIMSAAALLGAIPSPSDADIARVLAGRD